VSVETLLRLALVPAAIWLATLAARRWGHTVSGYLGGLPLIGGPITLYLALDHGAAFAARSATFTLAAILGQGAHLLAFAHVARRGTWPIALASGWTSFFVVAIAVAALDPGPMLALALAMSGLAAAWMGLPRPQAAAVPAHIPRAELHLRLVAAFLLAAAILYGADAFGPVASGVLLSMPVTGSIMPPFTLALHGADSVARLTRGFVVGLTGFTAFFLVIALTAVPWGTLVAFVCAIAAALVAVVSASRSLRIATRR
jgi:heme/copper-type cytochrome/quinol oxidase subunit 4